MEIKRNAITADRLSELKEELNWHMRSLTLELEQDNIKRLKAKDQQRI